MFRNHSAPELTEANAMRQTQLHMVSESITYLYWIIEITTFVFADLNADVHVCNACIFIHMRTTEKYTAAHKYLLNVTSFISWCFINMFISDDKVLFFLHSQLTKDGVHEANNDE